MSTRGIGSWLLVAVAAAVVLIAPRGATAQDTRERTTNLLEEAQERLAETTDETQRQQLLRAIELHKHRLGYRDSRDRTLTWDVSYQKRLLKSLDGEIARMESATKGGWGLASKGDDCKRAVRIVARDLLQRADQEPDENERARYGFAGMLLVHNADVIDGLMGRLEKIAEARKAAGDTETPEKDVLVGAVSGADSLIAMARQIADKRLRIGHGELWRLRRDLDRLRAGADFVAEKKLPPRPADPEEAEKQRQAEFDELARRAQALSASQPQMAGQLSGYVEQARFGVTVERVRPVAEAILAHTRIALDLAESLTAGKTGSEGYRRRTLERLVAAVAKVDDPQQRDNAYREINQVNRDDRERRNFESMPVADSIKADLWLGMEWIDAQMSKPADDAVRQEAERLRGPLQRLWWRTRDLYAARQPQGATFKTPYQKGLKAFEGGLALVATELRDPAIGIEQKCQRLDSLISDLHLVRETGCALDDLAVSMMPSLQIRNVGQQAAAALSDDNQDNDRAARVALYGMRDAFRLLAEFYDTALPKEILPEVNVLTRGRHQQTFKKQASRAESLIKTLVERDRQEYNVLQETMPLYRLTTEVFILGVSTTKSADTEPLRAARHVTVDPALVNQVTQPAADQLADVFLQLTKITPADIGKTVWPIARCERTIRPAVAALLEVRRESVAARRLDIVIDDLEATARGEPGGNIRDRWYTSWHMNQAIEAYLRGYDETGDHHSYQLRYRDPLLNVPLSDKKE
ncbi:MAG: hypothetical protein JXL80_15865 [Planctomycetes bacterium]|nr:hypothetical protein [Planctomycetota bacterium]